MPLILIARFLSSVVSLLALGVLIYLGWSWYEGQWAFLNGELVRVREDWRLGGALALTLWSVLGGVIIKPFLARPDGEGFRVTKGNAETIEVPGGDCLYIETHGVPGAPRVILTHGWGLDTSIWTPLVDCLRDQYRVITWDLPGMGRSRTQRRLSLPQFAQDLSDIIEHTGDERAFLVGHSIGGMTIQTLIRDRPDWVKAHVAGIIIINTTHTNPLRTMVMSGLFQPLRPLIELQLHFTRWLLPLSWLSAWQTYLNGTAHICNRLGFGRFVTLSQLEHTTWLSTRNSPGVQADGNLAMFRWDATGALASVDIPVLILAGASDSVTRPDASTAIAASALHGHLRIYEGAGHMGFVEDSSHYFPEIRAFIERTFVTTSPPPDLTGEYVRGKGLDPLSSRG